MNIPDLITMLGNLSQSLLSVQRLITGLAYIIGLLFIFSAFLKFKKVNESGHGSRESTFVPFAYLLAGVCLIYLPSFVTSLSNTTFGVGNVLSYSKFNTRDIRTSIYILMQTVGLIWFLRGCVLLTHASEPGVQHGPKGLMFLFAGILTINLESTVRFIGWLMTEISSFTLTSPPS